MGSETSKNQSSTNNQATSQEVKPLNLQTTIQGTPIKFMDHKEIKIEKGQKILTETKK